MLYLFGSFWYVFWVIWQTKRKNQITIILILKNDHSFRRSKCSWFCYHFCCISKWYWFLYRFDHFFYYVLFKDSWNTNMNVVTNQTEFGESAIYSSIAKTQILNMAISAIHIVVIHVSYLCIININPRSMRFAKKFTSLLYCKDMFLWS